MKTRWPFLLLILIFFDGFGQSDWKKEGIKVPAPICYGSGHSHASFVKPPLEFRNRLKSASAKKANLIVDYVDFPLDAQKAFQYAVDIWEELIYSPVPIRIQAKWQSLSAGVLGSCGPAEYFKNFDGTQKWNNYYPITLVEKMLQEEVNGTDEYDVIASFNKDFSNWYFGVDGKTPENHYDFVSTVLHEMAHGLGFSGYFYTSRGRGGYGDSDLLPAIFDHHVVGKDGSNLVNTSIYPNPSTKLFQGLTSGWLEFNDRLIDGSLPRLFAPTTWDSGSSIYHLDEALYPVGNDNSLMTPFADKGEANHNPGLNTLAILNEMGWKSISIKHVALKDIEFVSAPVEFKARIESDVDLDSTKLFLVYSTNKFLKADSVLLKSNSIAASFSTNLAIVQNSELSYYFSATDKEKRRFVYPSGAPSRYFNLKTGIDKEIPVVTHLAIKSILSSDPEIGIEAQATDNIGIKSVKVEYFINGGLIKSFALLNDSVDHYIGKLVFKAGEIKGGDQISYRIVATDVSSQSNIGKSPLSGYNLLKVEEIFPPVDKYANNFNLPTNDFISTDFTVSGLTGFDSPALNSAHPYPSPDADDTNFNLIAILKYPIILKQGGKLSFDEIVLVEPGEPGTKFGDQEFWDYVITEGSRDGGKTWKPLLDGYDSNSQTSWYNKFNSSFSGQNSTAVATKDLFVKREIDLLANSNFKAADTILIRFRLFSDPYSHGWGWMIDNLNIQDIGTQNNSLAISSGEVLFYPNPASDKLNLQVQTQKRHEKFVLKAYQSTGKMVFQQQFEPESTNFRLGIDVSSYLPGLYLFTIEADGNQPVSRKIVVR